MKIGVVVNPAAGRGKMKMLWPKISAALEHALGKFTCEFTERPGDGKRFAESFAAQAMDLVVAVGGDGTASEVADGLLCAGDPRPALALVPVGTGTDFVRNFGFGTDPMQAIEAIARGKTRLVDAGRIRFTGDDGGMGTRHFLNISSFGLSGPTVRAVNRLQATGRRPGRAVFFYHTLKQLMIYRYPGVRMVFDDEPPVDEEIAVVVVSNGQFFGAGMHVAPHARLDDGLFDVLIFKAAPKLKLLSIMATIYSGRHLNHPHVAVRRARSLAVTPLAEGAENAVLLDIDGESPGRIPAHYEILPQALRLRG